MLQDRQLQIREEDQEKPLLYAVREWVWILKMRRRKGESPKLQHKFMGPYEVLECYPYHTYLLSGHGQTSVQNECRLKRFRCCERSQGLAPWCPDPVRQAPRQGLHNRRSAKSHPEEALRFPSPDEFTAAARRSQDGQASPIGHESPPFWTFPLD